MFKPNIHTLFYALKTISELLIFLDTTVEIIRIRAYIKLTHL